MFTLSIPRVRTVSWIVEKVLKFAQQCSRHGKCWKIEVKSWKNGKSLLFFLKATTSASQVKSFSCLPNLIQSCLHVMEKAFIRRFYPVCWLTTRKGIWYSMDTSPISDSPFIGIGAARLRFVTEIVPKSPLLCVNRSPIRYGFHAGAKATWYQ